MEKIVLFSGGCDSTAMLYKLIEESTDKLHIHHIKIDVYKTFQHLVEYEAIHNILAWFRNNYPNRPFTYSESEISFSLGRCPEHYIWALHGGMLINSGYGNVMCTGRIATDNSPRGALSQERAESIFRIVTSSSNARWELPIDHLCKRDLIRTMPKELFELSWSCRNPIPFKGEYKWCYDCIGCLRRIEGMWQSGLYERDDVLYEKLSDNLDKKCPTIKMMSYDEIKNIEVGLNKLPPLPFEATAATYEFSIKEHG